MAMFFENSILSVLYASLIAFCITFTFMKLIPKYNSRIFGLSVSNKKTSKYHLPMVRGLGIIFPFILIFSSLVLENILNLLELSIITVVTLVGFWDDKYSLSYKSKLVIFFVLGSIFSVYTIEINMPQDLYLVKFLLNAFIFIFLIIFFNQIDGINGLATSTIIVALFFLYFNGLNLIQFFPIILSFFAYLLINMKGNIGIQGDAGSFFMGAFTAVLFVKSFDYFEYGFIFFVLSPIIFDVSSTTLVKFYYGINLSIGHRDNLYQRLVLKFQNHFLITGIFCFFQIFCCLTLIFLINHYSWAFVYIYLMFISACLTVIFCYFAYLIHNNKLFNER